MKAAKYWVAGAGGGLIAAFCCISPIVLVLLGFGTALGMALMHKFHLLSIVTGIVFMLFLSIYLIKRKAGVCNITTMRKHWNILGFAVLIMVAVLFGLNYLVIAPVASVVYGNLPVNQKPLGNLEAMAAAHSLALPDTTPEACGNKSLLLRVEGIFCGSCGPAVAYDIKSILGVKEVYQEDGLMSVMYDSGVTNKNVILAGFHEPYKAKILEEKCLELACCSL
jgi:hypothetical protein